MKQKFITTAVVVALLFNVAIAQTADRWQQRIQYTIDVTMNVTHNQFDGTEQIEYTNNSPDTLKRLFFYLYWNAFQPNSSMDVRSRELGKIIWGVDKSGNAVRDWDSRVQDRIQNLQPEEVGYQKIKSIKVDGVAQQIMEHETVAEIPLIKVIAPHRKTKIVIEFQAKVPLQVRRSGRDSKEHVRYSMSQWYPKMAEYDYQGWNTNPYIAREFYGVWGDYDVSIAIDTNYMVAATGMLQNKNQIGFGYEDAGVLVLPYTKPMRTWHFTGKNIHDFVWAADTAFVHISKKINNGVVLNVFYKRGDPKTDSGWGNLLWAVAQIFPYVENNFGKYPYPQYSFIQGGDGGMEYAMACLVHSNNIQTIFHEFMHSWYQHILGSNESLYPWMDEGFTTYAEARNYDYYMRNLLPQSPYIGKEVRTAQGTQYIKIADSVLPSVHHNTYAGYFNFAQSPYEESLATHADHFNTNYGYSIASYAKGAVFLEQLEYIVGKENFKKILLAYYHTWSFKHPNPNDFICVAQKVSNIQLQWYQQYWIYTTKKIDYGIGSVTEENDTTNITLMRVGKMPMPIDVLVTFKDSTKKLFYIPLDIMYGGKQSESAIPFVRQLPWAWVNPTYTLTIPTTIENIQSIEIDPSQRMADINRTNNLRAVPR